MEQGLTSSCTDATWWVFTLPALLGSDALTTSFLSILFAVLSATLLAWSLSPGGPAWANGRTRRGTIPIPGPRGLPVLGSLLTLTHSLPHRTLASMARSSSATQLMAFSIGSTPAVVSSNPSIAKEILSHPSFADRPLKQSARELMFGRAIGFAPSGSYWRLLRRIASTHLFSPIRVAAHEPARQADCSAMLLSIADEQASSGSVRLRPHLQRAALNNIMGSVFGKHYNVSPTASEVNELQEMVREGFDLLGAFNWSDHIPWLGYFYDPNRVKERCAALVPRVRAFVKGIIEDHRRRRRLVGEDRMQADNADFVDVLLSLQGGDKLDEEDMIAVLWEMVFRGTDTTALLTEWAMAELVLHPDVQERLREEVGDGEVTDGDLARMPYLKAVVKEALRMHPPGPLLSWSRLSTDDVRLGNWMVVPEGTTAMVNMWAITHDPAVWERAEEFVPERFLGGGDVDVRGGDLRLAPFGAGRRVCPGRSLGMATVALWVARLVQGFRWGVEEGVAVGMEEVLKLSMEMKTPLTAVAVPTASVGL